MSAFDKVIGYQTEKETLMRLCDMLRNRERYQTLGAKLPRGLLIYGEPGLGKSLMARCFMEEVGWTSYTVRRTKPDGDFVRELNRVFQEAAENAPAVILLDDMDKFVVEDKSQEEYVAVQAGIDEVAGKEVYVIATANDLEDIPDSLLRPGRFDRKLMVTCPKGEDGVKIVDFYLKGKALGESVNSADVAKMMGHSSCAALETALNEAAIYAGYEGSDKVEMRHIVQAVLQDEFDLGDLKFAADEDLRRRVACHEAGHAAMLELLCRDGVGAVAIRPGYAGRGGFTRACAQDMSTPTAILVGLGGYAATQLKYGVRDTGGAEDLRKVMNMLTHEVCGHGEYGMNLMARRWETSNTLLAQQETVISAELERYLTLTRQILVDNMEFLDALTGELEEKTVLLNSDVSRIRAGCALRRPDPALVG